MIKTDIPAPLINWPELLRLSRLHMSENKSEKGVMWDHAARIYYCPVGCLRHLA